MKNTVSLAIPRLPLQTILGLLLLTCILTLAGCGGSDTKVYSAQKTLVMRDSIYNVTDVKVYRSRFEAVISDTETVNLRDMEKKEFNALLDQHESLYVRVVFQFDDNDAVYRAKRIDSWGDFKDMRSRSEKGEKKLREFLGDPEETQLELD